MSDGHKWQEQRRFALHTLRDLGFGKFSIEESIRAELEDLISFIETESELRNNNEQRRAIDPALPLTRSVGNVICALVFGKRLSGEPEFDQFANIISSYIVPFFKKRPIVFMLSQ